VILAAPREVETVSGPSGAQASCVRGARLGLTVSRRVGGAVVRNRVKRRVREWFRTGAVRRTPVDLVVIARPGAAVLSYGELSRELDGLAERVLAALR